MSRRKPMVYIHHMHDHAREAVEMALGRSRRDLDTDRMLNLSLTRLMEVIGEASRRVPHEFRSNYPQVPWRDISDFRNQLIHAYNTVDFDTLWRIIQDELPPLTEKLESIISEKK